MPSVPGIPAVGVRAVVDQKTMFDAQMKSINQSIAASAQAAVKAAETTTRASASQAAGIGKTAAAFAIAGTVIVGALAVITAAISVALKAFDLFFRTAMRASTYEGIIASFDELTGAVGGLSSVLLNDLRKASAGMVSDMELMRLSNFALAGSVGEFGRRLTEDLPELMEIARVRARATGQSVEQLFQALVVGIKRSSPLLIDNTGLVIKISEANEAYAASLGKTVEEMTAEEQQIALLNETLRAGATQIELLANVQETAAEKVTRARATLENVKDTISLELQPVFEKFLDLVNTVLGGVAGLIENSVPYIRALVAFLSDALDGLWKPVQGFANRLNDPATAKGFWHGAVNAFGSFLGGVRSVAAAIVGVVADLAQAIADFLLGKSPPPKGPLSRMTEGAEATMLAWLEGFLGVSLEPISQVAKWIADEMGEIAGWSLEQVEFRLSQLDAAIKPFQDRVKVVRAEFDAIMGVADIALNRIDRQLNTAVEALVRGESGSSKVVRQLDAQRQSIEDALEVQRLSNEEYELQLGIMTAIQARERALLEIRKGQIPVAEEEKEAKEAVEKTTKDAAKKATGKEEKLPVETAYPRDRRLEPWLEPFEKFKDDNQFIQNALEATWDAAVGPGTKALATQEARLDSAMTTIRAFSNAPGGLMSGIFNKMFENVSQDFQGVIDEWNTFWGTTFPTKVNEIFFTVGQEVARLWNLFISTPFASSIISFVTFHTDSKEPNGIVGFFAGLPKKLNEFLVMIGTEIQTNLVDPIKLKVEQIRTFFDTLFNGDAQTQGSIQYFLETARAEFAAFPNRVAVALRALGRTVWTALVVPIINALNTLLTTMQTFIQSAMWELEGFLNDLAVGFNDLGLYDLSDQVNDVRWALAQQRGAFTIDLIPTAIPEWLQEQQYVPPPYVPGLASGGSVSKGMFKVGENGPEYLSSASRTSVFPNRIVQAMESMSRSVPYLTSALVQNGSSSYDNSRTLTNNFYGVRNAQDTRRRWSTMKAFI